MPLDQQAIAQQLFDAHKAGETFQPQVPGGSLDEAYAIQGRLQQLWIADGLGGIVGYKIALTSPAMQEFVGLDHPLAGGIFDSRVHTSPSQFDPEDFQHMGVECEIAVKLGADLPSREGGHTPETVAPAIGAVMPAFELIEDRNADYGGLDAFSLVADNSWNAGNVLGAPLTDWKAIDLRTVHGALRVNGETVGEGQGADALGSPLAAVAWLADQLAAQGKTLQRDMLVMTGSIVKTYFPNPGDSLVFTVEGLGEARMDFGGA